MASICTSAQSPWDGSDQMTNGGAPSPVASSELNHSRPRRAVARSLRSDAATWTVRFAGTSTKLERCTARSPPAGSAINPMRPERPEPEAMRKVAVPVVSASQPVPPSSNEPSRTRLPATSATGWPAPPRRVLASSPPRKNHHAAPAARASATRTNPPTRREPVARSMRAARPAESLALSPGRAATEATDPMPAVCAEDALSGDSNISVTLPNVIWDPGWIDSSSTRSPLTRVPLVLPRSQRVTSEPSKRSSACLPETDASRICRLLPGRRPTVNVGPSTGIDSPERSPDSKRRE